MTVFMKLTGRAFDVKTNRWISGTYNYVMFARFDDGSQTEFRSGTVKMSDLAEAA